MKQFVVYTLARIGVFIASYAVVAGVFLLVTDHVPILWPLLIAAVVSAVASVYLLKGMREDFAAVIDRRARAASRRFEEMRGKEDDDQ